MKKKDLHIIKADEIAKDKYGECFSRLNPMQQLEVLKLMKEKK